jgi:hypothetical protein
LACTIDGRVLGAKLDSNFDQSLASKRIEIKATGVGSFVLLFGVDWVDWFARIQSAFLVESVSRSIDGGRSRSGDPRNPIVDDFAG